MNNKIIKDAETNSDLRDGEGGDGLAYNSNQLVTQNRKTLPLIWAPDGFYLDGLKSGLQKLTYNSSGLLLSSNAWFLNTTRISQVTTRINDVQLIYEDGRRFSTNYNLYDIEELVPGASVSSLPAYIRPALTGSVSGSNAIKYSIREGFSSNTEYTDNLAQSIEGLTPGAITVGFYFPARTWGFHRDDQIATTDGDKGIFTLSFQSRLKRGSTPITNWDTLFSHTFAEWEWSEFDNRRYASGPSEIIGPYFVRKTYTNPGSFTFEIRLYLSYTGNTIHPRGGGDPDQFVHPDQSIYLNNQAQSEDDTISFTGRQGPILYFRPFSSLNWTSFAQAGLRGRPISTRLLLAGLTNFSVEEDKKPAVKSTRLRVISTSDSFSNLDVFDLMRVLAEITSSQLGGSNLIPSSTDLFPLRNRLFSAGIVRRFNGAIQDRKYLFEIYKQLLMGVRLQPHWLHGKLAFIAEDVRLNEDGATSIATYNPSNILKSSFTLKKEINRDEKAGNCAVKYYDDLNDKERVVEIAVDDDGAIVFDNSITSPVFDNRPSNFQQITLRGWNFLSHNRNLAIFKARLSKFWRETITFKTPYLGYAPLPGEVITVIHPTLVVSGDVNEGDTDAHLTEAINASAPTDSEQERTKWVVLSSTTDFNNKIQTITARTYDSRAYTV